MPHPHTQAVTSEGILHLVLLLFIARSTTTFYCSIVGTRAVSGTCPGTVLKVVLFSAGPHSSLAFLHSCMEVQKHYSSTGN